MRLMKTAAAAAVLMAALGVFAEYEAKITFNNGAVRTVKNLVVQGGKLILAKENLQVPFDQIQGVTFEFEDPLTPDACEVFLKRAAYKEMLKKVNGFLAPVEAALPVADQLDVYVQYRMRAAFWAGQYNIVESDAKLLQAKNSEYAPLSRLYQVLVLLEKDAKDPAAAQAVAQIDNPEDISKPIAEFIRGRLAMAARKYDVALQHFSNVIVYHGRDPEWAPAAAFYEGNVYKRTGYLESASNIADELKIAYPDADWGRRADELK